jgi:hypothetical protein
MAFRNDRMSSKKPFSLFGREVDVGACRLIVGVGMFVGCVTVGVAKGAGVPVGADERVGIVVVGHVPRQ